MADRSSSAGLLPNEFFFEPPLEAGKSAGHEDPYFGWSVGFGDNINFHKSRGSNGVKLLLFGELFDAGSPARSTQKILDILSEADRPQTLPALTGSLTGQFVMVATLGDDFLIFTDACGQMELFYHFQTPSFFASSPLLLPSCPAPDTADRETRNCCNPLSDLPEGSSFCKLPPNFCFSSRLGGVERYFPVAGRAVEPFQIDEAVEVLCTYLTGIFTAMRSRRELAVPITAGYDSRLLTAACVASGAKGAYYYLYKHRKLSANHHDIRIGGNLAKAIGVKRVLLEYPDLLLPAEESMFKRLYRPRLENAARIMNGDKKYFADRTVINGNLGEIGRSYFGALTFVTPEMLAKLRNKKGDPAEIQKMQAWLDSFDQTHLGAENISDLFYWEDRMANWAARAKTEYRLVTRAISPLNCHKILTMILGVPKKDRSYYHNHLFERAIRRLEPRLSPFPYNPELKSTAIKTLISAGIYGAYKNFQIKHL